MAEALTSDQIRTTVIAPLMSLIGELSGLCNDWDKAVRDGEIKRPDLYLNEKMAMNAINSSLPAFNEEIRVKLGQAKRGVYRYRDAVWASGKQKKKKRE